MRRYQGEPLPARPRIAVLANDALGNYVVSTPLLQMLRSRNPEAQLDYYSGQRVEELWSRDGTLSHGFGMLGQPPLAAVKIASERTCGRGYDLVINIEIGSWHKTFAALAVADSGAVCGPCLGPDSRKDLPFEENDRGRLWQDTNWIAEDLPKRYDFLQSGFIGEIFCRLAYLEGPLPDYSVPVADAGRDIPDVLIATAASLPEKLWPEASWLQALRSIRARGLNVGLLGAKPESQKQFWRGSPAEDQIVESGLVTDLRGAFTLPQVAGALKRAQIVLTLDNGILHLAAAVGARTVGLFRYGIHRLWAPPVPNLTVLTPAPGGEVADVTVDEVLRAL